MRAQVLHVIQQLSRGGASQGLLHLLANLEPGSTQHRVASLLPPVANRAAQLRQHGVEVYQPRDTAALLEDAAGCDLVQVSFWNSPELYRFLRSALPPMRLLLWVMVAGDTAPHMLPGRLLELADLSLLCCPYSWQLPCVQNQRELLEAGRLGLLQLSAELASWLQLEPVPHPGFRVGYAGSVDFAKLHPDYLALHQDLAIPGLSVTICGDGRAVPTLARQIAARGLADRFRLRGFVDPLADCLASWDVFGYPLAEGGYASAELVLQQAMAAGLPAVVLAHGSAARIVQHGQTGLVAQDARAYRQALEYLYRQPEERRRLGAQARWHARQNFDPARMARDCAGYYQRLLQQPKRSRHWKSTQEVSRNPGAQAFIDSLTGAACAPFIASLEGSRSEQLAAEAQIAAVVPVVASADAGGILHYRRAYPEDAPLALWAGLVLLHQGRPALAVAELRRAIAAGLDQSRVWGYLSRAALACGARELATSAQARALREQP